MFSFGWPDVVVAGVLLLATLKGFARGLVAELGGIVAVALALVAAFFYNGAFDAFFQAQLHVAASVAHVAGMVAAGIVVYLVATVAIWILARFAKLPVLGTLNALAGAVAGFAKGFVLLWLALLIALLLPLSPQMRAALQQSLLVSVLARESAVLDRVAYGWLPDGVKPLVQPVIERDRF
jgi:uncharacterized membrane protein required for colicin V production